jgi:hypothetical protein
MGLAADEGDPASRTSDIYPHFVVGAQLFPKLGEGLADIVVGYDPRFRYHKQSSQFILQMDLRKFAPQHGNAS